MIGICIRPELTVAQKRALRWLYNRGGEGVFNKNQTLLAHGELAGVMRTTWNSLSNTIPPCVDIFSPRADGKGYKRVSLLEAGRAIALAWTGAESDTVEDNDDA